MRTVKRRLDKLESYHGGQFLAWLKMATDDELEARLRESMAKWRGASQRKGCTVVIFWTQEKALPPITMMAPEIF